MKIKLIPSISNKNMKMNIPQRQHYLDWLRIMAILGVLIVHSGMPYADQLDWHIKDKHTSPLLLLFNGMMHIVRMPLLFFISGTVSFYMMRNRSAWNFIKLRFIKLALPLFIGMLFIVPPQIYLERLNQGFQGSFLEFYKTVFEFKPYPMGGSFSWHHLWFIAYLFVYDVIFAPLFSWMIAERSWQFRQSLSNIFRGQLVFTMAIPSVIGYTLFSHQFEMTNDLIHDYCYFIYWLLFLLAGFICVVEPSLMNSLQRYRRTSAGICFTALLLLYFLWLNGIPAVAKFVPILDQPLLLLQTALSAITAWGFVFGVIGYGKHYLNCTKQILPYLNQAVYPFYILHQTVIVWLTFHLVKMNDSVLMKYLFTIGATLFITMGIFHFFIRPYKLMKFLFGMKSAIYTKKIAKESLNLPAITLKKTVQQ